jgi:PEP-CTERM motif
MRPIPKIAAITFIACLCGSAVADAATVVLSGVVATAIDGVVVNGVTYNVTFAFDVTDTTFANNAAAVATAVSEVNAALNGTIAEFVSVPGLGSIDNFTIGDRFAGGTTVANDAGAGTWHNVGSIAFAPDSNSVFTPAVPEPSTWAMGLIGFGLMGFLGYRKTRSALA